MKGKMNKKGQEEMVGFALIVIVMAIVLLIFLSFVIKGKSKQEVESYEASSFIQSVLQYTTNCSKDYEMNYQTIQGVLFECIKGKACLDGRDSCEVLKKEIEGMLKSSWKVGNESPIKGYSFRIEFEGEEILSLSEGNETSNYKGSLQSFRKAGKPVEIRFKIFY